MNTELTEAQRFHNLRLDFEIKMADRHNKHVNEMNKLKIDAWERQNKQNPEQFHPFPNIDMSMPRRVFGIRYVE